jgi:endonuclease-3 related protein
MFRQTIFAHHPVGFYSPAMSEAVALRKAYELMHARFGYLNWWPGDTPFEVAVGAILTQNTAWTNVEKAIANLKYARVLTPRKLYALPEATLAQHIRPAGYFNLKARRLRNFLSVLIDEFGGRLDRMLEGELTVVRERLLAINGIGRETADSMLLYAGTHHSFVIDAYTKRIFERHGWWSDGPRSAKKKAKSQTADTYGSLKQLCEAALNHKSADERQDYWRDYHAQIVMVGKDYCRPRNPDCTNCPLNPLLPKANGSISD